jgi:hypothetical protein
VRIAALRIASLIVLVLAGSPLAANSAACPLTDQELSERIDALTTWRSIFDYQKRFFPPCPDEGAFSQAHSELVVRTLAQRWNEVSDLGAITDEDPEFKAFVLRHINSKSSRTNLQTVLTYTTIRCPGRRMKLCTELRGAVSRALEELR